MAISSLRTNSCMAVGCAIISILGSGMVALAATMPEQVKSTIDTIESKIDSGVSNIESSLESLLKSTVEELLGLNCPGVLFIVESDKCPNTSGSISTSTVTSPDRTGETDSSSPPASQVETSRIKSPPTNDLLSANSFVKQRDLANLDDQEYARENAAPYLGQTGRQQIQKQTSETAELIKGNLEAATTIKKLAADANDLTVTQEVMKNHAQMFEQLGDIAASSSRLDGQVYLGILSLQQQQASLMQQAANLGEGIDEANRHERLDQDVTAIAAMRTSVYLPFRQPK